MSNLKKKHKSKQPWLNEHFNDVYVKMAMKEGYRSRAVYKLQEINERDGLFQPGMTVVDLGAAPGGWSQIAAKYVGEKLEPLLKQLLSWNGALLVRITIVYSNLP